MLSFQIDVCYESILTWYREMAADYAKFSTNYELLGGYLSPVSDAYRKAGLANAEHRYVLQVDWTRVD
jgi:hypothetical protein